MARPSSTSPRPPSPPASLPGTSNFIAGQSASRRPIEKIGTRGQYICHQNFDPDPEDPYKQHCFWLCDGCQIP